MTLEILVTGASGFVGGRVSRRLVRSGHRVTSLVRPGSEQSAHANTRKIRHDLSESPLDTRGFDFVVHCAGEVTPSDPRLPLDESVNVKLARNIALGGTKRLIFISSIAASQAEIDPTKASRYGIEKLASEHAARAFLPAWTKCVFVRPPAIYGPGSQGPLAALAKLVKKGMPLPLGCANTPRPYLAAQNFESFMNALVTATESDWTLNNLSTPEPHDGVQLSTKQVCEAIAAATRQSARLLPVPTPLLRLAGASTGKSALIRSALDAVPVRYDRQAFDDWHWSPEARMPDTLKYLNL
ncbi:NAD-dependent epimerase/dehydratase family protein [Marivivens aquimaris]|uniref:NAD-dependent epimerase/dehydratase family protein n=1 Tax=Marivivens aquimaris TaxID=2774876 RepID=UPI00187F88C0|nr:NAD-dependent epimerase/dehydratase family protein [Marivivens aquimaris]